MQYGLMPPYDYYILDYIFAYLCKLFPKGTIYTTEIGVHNGNGSRGIHEFFTTNSRSHVHTGIDNQQDFKMGSPFPECKFIIGNSIEVYNQVEDNSQHFILVDGCHNYPMTMADFLVYKDKVKDYGLIAFHDTSPLIPKFKDYQGMGSRDDPDMFISCRKALKNLGLLDNEFQGWEILFDDYDHDPNIDTGGIVAVQKRKKWARF